jgi:hypothetical protein
MQHCFSFDDGSLVGNYCVLLSYMRVTSWMLVMKDALGNRVHFNGGRFGVEKPDR